MDKFEKLRSKEDDNAEAESELCTECDGEGSIIVTCKLCDGTQWVGGRPGGEICCGGYDNEPCPTCGGSGLAIDSTFAPDDPRRGDR